MIIALGKVPLAGRRELLRCGTVTLWNCCAVSMC